MKTKRWHKIKRMVKLTTFVRTQIIGQSAELQTLAAVVRFHSSVPYGYGAWLVEQLAFNQLNAGSIPVVPTIMRIQFKGKTLVYQTSVASSILAIRSICDCGLKAMISGFQPDGLSSILSSRSIIRINLSK